MDDSEVLSKGNSSIRNSHHFVSLRSQQQYKLKKIAYEGASTSRAKFKKVAKQAPSIGLGTNIQVTESIQRKRISWANRNNPSSSRAAIDLKKRNDSTLANQSPSMVGSVEWQLLKELPLNGCACQSADKSASPCQLSSLGCSNT
jgi:hypothetical protein